MNGEYKGKRHPPFTSETAKQAARKGNAKSTETKRRRKALREWALIFRDLPANGKSEITNGAAVIRKVYENAIAGDIISARFLSDLMGEMKTKVEIKAIPKLIDDI